MEARRANPIFILGAMGSGTTLLRVMLDSHERIAIPGETGFMRSYEALRFAPFKYSGHNWTKRLGWKRKELDELAGEFYDTLFMRYAEQQGKQRWGEKTPLHTWHIDGIARLFPNAQFVVIVRHPFASISSNINRFKMKLWASEYHWRRIVSEQARQAARHPERMAFLRYEDLVMQPEATMRELLDWLGEPWSDAVLEHHLNQAGRSHAVGGAAGDRRREEGRVRFDDPVDVSRIDKWTRTITPQHKSYLMVQLGRLGEFYGYSADSAAPVRPLGEAGRLLAPAAAIAARIDEFPDLNLQTPGPRYLQDEPYDPRKVTLISNEEHRKLTRAATTRLARRRGRARRRLRRLMKPVKRRPLVMRLVGLSRRITGRD